jgi:DNA repair protein RadC
VRDNNSISQDGDKQISYLKIQEWAKEDRPREKLIQKGPSVLSEAELIGILLGSGTKNLSAVGLAQTILKQHNYDLNELAKRSVKELQKFKGIGEAKAVSIVSAMELGRRRRNNERLPKARITNSSDIYELIRMELSDKLIEEFWIITLTRANYVIKKHLISSGGTAQLAVDPKFIFKTAIDHHAASIILIHNHPSNNSRLSQLDIELTERLVKGGKILGIPILDHIIFTEDTYFSFSDEHMVI